jgi:DNA-binding MarR family transcriptional regulator
MSKAPPIQTKSGNAKASEGCTPRKSKGQQTALNSIVLIIKAFRSLKGLFPLQHAETFLHIAMRPGITVKELCDLTGQSQSSMSRHIAEMTLAGRDGRPGHDLVEDRRDPVETRRVAVFLTPKGKDFVSKLLKNVDPDLVYDAPSHREAIQALRR